MFNNHVRKTFIKLIVTNCNVRLKSLTMHYINQLIFQEVYLILWSLSTKIIQNKTPQKTFKNRKGSLDVGASTRTAWDKRDNFKTSGKAIGLLQFNFICINITYPQTLRWQCRVQVAGAVWWWEARAPARQSPWRDSSS